MTSYRIIGWGIVQGGLTSATSGMSSGSTERTMSCCVMLLTNCSVPDTGRMSAIAEEPGVNKDVKF